MSGTDDPNDIKLDRQLMLDLLLQAWPRSFKGGTLYRLMLGGGESSYSERDFARDLTYLTGKGYIEVCRPAVHAHLTSKGKFWRLTTAGSEIAQRIESDSALEI